MYVLLEKINKLVGMSFKEFNEYVFGRDFDFDSVVSEPIMKALQKSGSLYTLP